MDKCRSVPGARNHARGAPAGVAADRGRHWPPGLAFAGRVGLLSDILDRLKINVVFTTTAVVLAICFVAGPFYVRQAIASFEVLEKATSSTPLASTGRASYACS